MNKPFLFLLPSFPTNSILLSGLIAYLEESFTVHCLDIPGFLPEVPETSEYSFQELARLTKERIEAFQPSEYYLAGISFGYGIINELPEDPRCVGIFAVEPYLGSKYLRFRHLQKFMIRFFLAFLWRSGIFSYLWNTRKPQRGAGPLRIETNSVKEIMSYTVSATALYKGALLILQHKELQLKKKHIPHVLIINLEDSRLRAVETERELREKIEQLLVIHTDMPHFPEDLSAAYFSKSFKKDMPTIVEWLEKNSNMQNHLL